MAHEPGRFISQIEAGQGIFFACGAAVREDDAHLAFGEDVLIQAGGDKILRRKSEGEAFIGKGPSSHVQKRQVRISQLAKEFHAEGDRNLTLPEQADASAEKGIEVFSAPSEVENLGPLQEERPFLGEIERKPGQIDAAVVDFRFGEICIIAKGADEIGSEILVEVEPAFGFPGRSRCPISYPYYR